MDYTELHQSCLPYKYVHWSHSFNRHSSPINRCNNLIQTHAITIASYKRIADSSVGQALKMAEEVILLDILGSSFGMRIALKSKGLNVNTRKRTCLIRVLCFSRWTQFIKWFLFWSTMENPSVNLWSSFNTLTRFGNLSFPICCPLILVIFHMQGLGWFCWQKGKLQFTLFQK